MTSNQLSSPLCVKCMEERRQTQLIRHVYRSLLPSTNRKKDLLLFGPCSKVLHQKIKRCIYVASIWTNSLRTDPTPDFPTSFGWMLDEDGTYCHKWFDGDVAPKIVEVVKDDSCTGYGEFSKSKIQRRLLQNNGDTNFVIQPSF